MMRGVRHWAVAVRKPTATTGLGKPEAMSADGAGASSGGLSTPDDDAVSNGASPTDGALGEIEVTTFPLTSALARHRWLRIPVLRGIVALGGSLAIGFKALGISANAQLPEGESEEDAQEIGAGIWAGTIVVALVFAIGLFFLLPLGLTSLVKGQLHSSALFWIV